MAKQGLRKSGIKRPKVVSFEKNVKEKEKKKRRRGRRRIQAKIKLRYGCLDFGMETTFSRDFVWITWNLRLDMVNLLSLNLGF